MKKITKRIAITVGILFVVTASTLSPATHPGFFLLGIGWIALTFKVLTQ